MEFQVTVAEPSAFRFTMQVSVPAGTVVVLPGAAVVVEAGAVVVTTIEPDVVHIASLRTVPTQARRVYDGCATGSVYSRPSTHILFGSLKM
jgi:hypothetical protein